MLATSHSCPACGAACEAASASPGASFQCAQCGTSFPVPGPELQPAGTVPALELGETLNPAVPPGAGPVAPQQAPAAGELLELPDAVTDPDARPPGRPIELLPVPAEGRSVNWAMILGIGGLLALVLLVVGLTMAALFIPRLTEKRAQAPSTPPATEPAPRPVQQGGGRPQRRPIGAMAIAIGGAVIGRPAPDIQGEDLDGKRFNLSDYRGKVVVVVFWADSSAACREAYALERRLVQRRDGQPFVLLGVNRDQDREHAKQVARDEHLTWRSWWDGDPQSGVIGKIWLIKQLPTIFVLDARGIVRFKTEGAPPEAELDRTINELLQDVPRENR
jgi:peroxiredoxin